MGNTEKIFNSLYEWLYKNEKWFYSYKINHLGVIAPFAIIDFKCSGSVFLKATAQIYYCEFGIKRQIDELINKFNAMIGFNALTEYKGE